MFLMLMSWLAHITCRTYRDNSQSLEDCFWEAWSCLISSSSHLKVQFCLEKLIFSGFIVFCPYISEELWNVFFFDWTLYCDKLQQRTHIGRVIGFVLAIWGILFYSRLLSTMTEQFRVSSWKEVFTKVCWHVLLSSSYDHHLYRIICKN